jgi:hypothetical protein
MNKLNFKMIINVYENDGIIKKNITFEDFLCFILEDSDMHIVLELIDDFYYLLIGNVDSMSNGILRIEKVK